MRRSPALAALVLSLALGTAACGNDDDDAAPPRTDATSASPSPSATPSWSATAKPQRPADEFSQEGAEAFAVFAADTVLYMMATGDVPALTAISDLATCTSCQGWVDNYDDGKIEKLTVSSGPARHDLVDEPSVNDEVYFQVRLALDIPQGESVRKDTGKKIGTVNAAEALPFKTNIQWKGDQWQLLTYDLG
ncbi:hypothetical protein H9L21_10190 [Aeromicrobium senzhongii]|uniref:DUF6318 domain-containing protein n=1 Tax=Aeromicrobium senzhongii TaxID=2663859 RepID=A0ABX6SQZ8_9ACTN|nr:DUF6318 family protein [Aeromicrobium senzhongii]QNL93486.1 hypothetical protein H9L21_10190 [Aeromicrobium senzhongii]